jgi:hypothetical protein
VATFNQKLVEEGERTEIGFIGVLKEVLCDLWSEKQSQLGYKTDDDLVKISNKEIYDKFNAKLKKEAGEGISPAKFKEYMLEFGFTDALNRKKLEVPIPSDPDAKSRLCNIFTNNVLKKIGIDLIEKENQKKIEELAKNTKSIHRLNEESQAECICCDKRNRVDWQVDYFDGSWGMLCGPCGQKLSERLSKVD